MGILTGYLGAYLSPESDGVYRFTLDTETGALTAPTRFLDVPDSKYLALRGDGLLASIVRRENGAGIALAALRGDAPPRIHESLTDRISGCYAAFDGGRAYTANFHEGTVPVYRIVDGVPIHEHTIAIAPKAGCHQAVPHGRYLLVSCMNLDEVRIFDTGDHFAPHGALAFPRGSGPRHLVFDRAHTRLFAVTQAENAVYTFRAEPGGAFTLLGRTALLPDALLPGSEAAAIRLSGDERFLYVSVRGANRIAVLSVSGTGTRVLTLAPCGGDHPRDIALAPGGRFLLAANRYSGNLVCFPVDPASGLPGKALSEVPAHQGVSIVFDAPEKG